MGSTPQQTTHQQKIPNFCSNQRDKQNFESSSNCKFWYEMNFFCFQFGPTHPGKGNVCLQCPYFGVEKSDAPSLTTRSKNDKASENCIFLTYWKNLASLHEQRYLCARSRLMALGNPGRNFTVIFWLKKCWKTFSLENESSLQRKIECK